MMIRLPRILRLHPLRLSDTPAKGGAITPPGPGSTFFTTQFFPGFF